MLDYVLGTHGEIIDASIIDCNRGIYRRRCDDVDMSIGGRIKLLRESAGLSQPELARRIGIKQPSLSSIESGNTKSLRAATLMRLAGALSANPYYLWTGAGSPVAQIDQNVEEAQVVDTYRRLSSANQRAWLAAGTALLNSQPATAPTNHNPYPAAPPAGPAQSPQVDHPAGRRREVVRNRIDAPIDLPHSFAYASNRRLKPHRRARARRPAHPTA